MSEEEKQDLDYQSAQFIEELIHAVHNGGIVPTIANHEQRLTNVEGELAQNSRILLGLGEKIDITNDHLGRLTKQMTPYRNLRDFVEFVGNIPKWLKDTALGRGLIILGVFIAFMAYGNKTWGEKLIKLLGLAL